MVHARRRHGDEVAALVGTQAANSMDGREELFPHPARTRGTITITGYHSFHVTCGAACECDSHSRVRSVAEDYCPRRTCVLHQTFLQLAMHEAASKKLASHAPRNECDHKDLRICWGGLQAKRKTCPAGGLLVPCMLEQTCHLHDSDHRRAPHLSALPILGRAHAISRPLWDWVILSKWRAWKGERPFSPTLEEMVSSVRRAANTLPLGQVG